MPPMLSRTLLSALALLPLAGEAAAVEKVGTAAAVNQNARSGAAGQMKVLELGADVIFRQRIQTEGTGSVQVLFADKSTLNIGPNSDLLIDEFVYEPAKGTGRMATTLVKGVVRFVGGQVSHTGEAVVKTPAATIGIRGGVATIRHNTCRKGEAAGECEGTRAISHFGRMRVTNGQGTQEILRPGFGVSVASNGTAPASPDRASAQEINVNNRLLTSGPSQTGGVRRPPSDLQAVNLGVERINAGVGPGVKPVQGQTTSLRPPNIQPVLPSAADPTRPVDNPQGIQAGKETARNPSNPGQPPTKPDNPQNPPTDPGTRPPRVKQAFTLTTVNTQELGGGLSFLPSAVLTSGAYKISPVLAYTTSDTDGGGSAAAGAKAGRAAAAGSPPYNSRTMQAALAINGQGRQQTSTLYVGVGMITETASGFSASSTARISSRRGADQPVSGSRLAYGTAPGGVAADANGVPASLTLSGAYNPASSGDPANVRTFLDGRQPTFSPNGASVTTERSENAPGLGGNRPAVTLNGWVGGMMQSVLGADNEASKVEASPFAISNANKSATDVAITLDPETARVSSSFNVANQRGGRSDTFSSASFVMGSAGAGQPGRSTYVDYDNFAAIEARRYDGAGSPTVELSTVNGEALTSSRQMLVTSKTVDPTMFFPNVQFCACEFTRWGFWSADTTQAEVFQDRTHLSTWVAGVLPSAGEVPVAGTATYTGHAIGSFVDGSANYVAAGGFSNTVDFARGTGAVTVSNLDGRTYTGSVSLNPGNRVGFSGAATASANGSTAQMDLAGSFFRGTAGPVGEMGGSFIVNKADGSVYRGAGTFAASTPSAPGVR